MENLKPKDAAEMLGISYPTIKQWIYDSKIKSVKTPGGHHRIPASEIERLTGNKPESRATRQNASEMEQPISVRNRLIGIVTSISYEGFFAEVAVDVGGQRILSYITRRGCEEMGLKVGMHAYALFKATEVMISRR